MSVTIVYSHDDAISGRWTGEGRPLTHQEVNLDLYNLKTAVEDLQDGYTATISIASVTQPSAAVMRVTKTDASYTDITLLSATFRDRGAWAIDTPYLVNDTFTANGALYRVLFDHTSDDTSFDPNANDGAGHDYYAAMLSSPGNSLPAGGAENMVVEKSSSTDYAYRLGYKLPTGGSARQYLIKQSSANQDGAWDDPTASDIGFSPSTGSALVSTNVADALEELEGIAGTGGGGGSGRKTIWMPAGQMTPMITDGAATGLVETSIRKNVIKTLDFDATSDEGAQFEIAMPKSWDRGDVSFRVFWSHATASTNFGVAWNVYASTFSPGVDMDGWLNNGVLVTSTGGTQDTLYVSAETDPITVFDVGGAPPAENALLVVQVWRVPPNAGDTLAVDARLQGVQLFYNASAGNDD
jgi:hypothetical protein